MTFTQALLLHYTILYTTVSPGHGLIELWAADSDSAAAAAAQLNSLPLFLFSSLTRALLCSNSQAPGQAIGLQCMSHTQAELVRILNLLTLSRGWLAIWSCCCLGADDVSDVLSPPAPPKSALTNCGYVVFTSSSS